jgi:alpha-tubulin suppressor-like RCC1 family protein
LQNGQSFATAIAASANHNLAIKSVAGAGRVVAWGSDSQQESEPPLDLINGSVNAVGIAAGAFHSLALRSSGIVEGWGADGSGQSSGSLAVNSIVQIAAGGDNSLALRADGKVVAWGYQNGGLTPPPAGLSNVVAIAAGQYHSLAIFLEPPVITVQPATQTVLRGSDVSFAIQASGSTPLRFQWRKNGADISKATNASYFIANVQTNDVALYTVAVSNAAGMAVSDPAGLIVNIPAEIIVEPQSVTATAGSNVSFSVTAIGTLPLRYKWRKNGSTIFGATSSRYSIANVQSSDAATYDVVVDNDYGMDTSSPAVLSVNLPPSITVPPQNQTVFVGNSVTFSVTATGATGYQWRRNNNDISNATNSIYTIIGVQLSDQGSFTVRVTNSYGSVIGGPATLTVNVRSLSGPGMVIGWGQGQVFDGMNYVDVTPPTNLAGVVAIAAGAGQSLALLGDRTVFGWGDNSAGQAAPPGNLADVAAISAGGSHSLALKSNSTVVAWGSNAAGQTGVPAALSNVIAIAAGGNHSLALLNNGLVVGWGTNNFGQRTAPPGVSNLVAIAAGFEHSLGLRQNGTVAGWGENEFGQAVAPASLSNVVAIAAGETHSMALRRDGTVMCWGQNNHGQLNTPTGLSGVVAIAAGDNHCLALRNNGTVVAWGQNNYGQTDVPAGLVGVLAIAAGGDRSLALTRTPLRFQLPERLTGNRVRFSLGNSDGSPLEPERVVKIQIFSTTDPALAFSSWSRLTNSLTLINGVLQFIDTTSAVPPRRFYIATEVP